MNSAYSSPSTSTRKHTKASPQCPMAPNPYQLSKKRSSFDMPQVEDLPRAAKKVNSDYVFVNPFQNNHGSSSKEQLKQLASTKSFSWLPPAIGSDRDDENEILPNVNTNRKVRAASDYSSDDESISESNPTLRIATAKAGEDPIADAIADANPDFNEIAQIIVHEIERTDETYSIPLPITQVMDIPVSIYLEGDIHSVDQMMSMDVIKVTVRIVDNSRLFPLNQRHVSASMSEDNEWFHMVYAYHPSTSVPVWNAKGVFFSKLRHLLIQVLHDLYNLPQTHRVDMIRHRLVEKEECTTTLTNAFIKVFGPKRVSRSLQMCSGCNQEYCRSYCIAHMNDNKHPQCFKCIEKNKKCTLCDATKFRVYPM